MANISKMKSSELEKVLTEAKKELARRHRIRNACEDIEKVLKKYQLKAMDIDWSQLHQSTKAGNRKKPVKKSNSKPKITAKRQPNRDKRSSVAPKYSNPNGKEKWTGRGRAPTWVVNICEQENIGVKDFKLDPRFKA